MANLNHPARKKHHQRTIDRIHLAIRMELSFPPLSANVIAQRLGMTATSYSLLKKTHLYSAIHSQYMNGVLTQLDANISDTLNVGTRTLDFAVPIALEGLLQQALKSKNERVQNKAFNDILDRDGRFAKKTRMDVVTHGEAAAAGLKDNDVANELVRALNSTKNIPGPSITDPPLTETEQ